MRGRRRARPGSVAVLICASFLRSSIAAAAPAPIPAPISPLSPAPPAVGTPRPPRARIYVEDLDHLAQLVKADAVASPMADSLVRRKKAAVGTMVASGTVGLLLVVLSFTAFKTTTCASQDLCTSDPNETLSLLGLGLAAIGPIAGMVLLPRRNDLLDVINTWNSHLDNPFAIDAHEIRAH